MLEESIRYVPHAKERLMRIAVHAPLVCYLGAILSVWFFTVAATAAAGLWLGAVQLAGVTASFFLLVLFAGAALQIAVSAVNWFCTLIVPPRPIMRMDFSKGIPAEHRTIVVVPTMLTDKQAVHDLVRQLELRRLANQDDNLLFALLTDFPDADREITPADRPLLALARREIRRLNKLHCSSRRSVFYLLHRPRKWNRQEGLWMGEERKRGKLAALNWLLVSGVKDAFSIVEGDPVQLRSVR